MDGKKSEQGVDSQVKDSTSTPSSKSSAEGSETTNQAVSTRSSGSGAADEQPSPYDKWTVILGLMVVFMVTVCASYLAWAFLLERSGQMPTFPADMPDNASNQSATGWPITDGVRTTPKTPRIKSPLAQSVVCHYGSNEETVVALPPDGVCDYTFCEQFYTRSHKGFLEGMTADQATFMESAGRHTRTEYGISFPVVALGAVHLDLSKEAAASSVSRYWGMRFYHYGFVTMELGRSYKELKHVLEVLKMVKKLVTPLTWRQDRPSYTAIGWNEKDTSMVKDAVRTMKTTLMPDFIIVHGHRVYAGSNPSPERVSAPTNMFVDKDTSAIVQTLGQAVKSLKALSRTRITAALALSVSMSAFGYNLKNADLPDGTGAMFQEANDSSVPPFTEYRHVCGYPGDYFYSRERYNYSYNFRYRYQDGRILLWDTEGSLREKMCRLKRNNTKVPYSLAAYDLDWDDEEDTCAFANWFGAYSRVKMVRVLSDFFHDGFSRAHDEADCLVIGDEF